jgi:hypothetical protein
MTGLQWGESLWATVAAGRMEMLSEHSLGQLLASRTLMTPYAQIGVEMMYHYSTKRSEWYYKAWKARVEREAAGTGGRNVTGVRPSCHTADSMVRKTNQNSVPTTINIRIGIEGGFLELCYQFPSKVTH